MARFLTPSALAAAAVAALAITAGADGKPDKPRKPKPKPRIELLTTKQEAALRRGSIKVTVYSKRGRKARVRGAFVIDGYPDNFAFGFGPKTKRLRGKKATFRVRLNAREREVLDFAIKSCRWAKVDVRARVGRGKDRAVEHLRRPDECRPG